MDMLVSCKFSQEICGRLELDPGVWEQTQIQGFASLEQTKVTASSRAQLCCRHSSLFLFFMHTHTEPLTSHLNSDKKLFLASKQANFIEMGEGKEKTVNHQTLISFHGKCLLSSSSDYD